MAEVGKKRGWKTFLIVVSFLMSLFTTVAVGYSLTNARKTTENVKSYEYELGTIDESGKIVDSRKSTIMKTARNVEGVTIDIDEETATIVYRVVFYGADGEYLSVTEPMETDYDVASTPEGAETFRVIITPYQVDGEDVKLSGFNMLKYSSQLEITYNK